VSLLARAAVAPFILLALLVNLAGSAEAARKKPANVARARKEFKLAKKEAELGHFKKAIDHFEKAYSYERVPALLFNIGQCHRYLKDYDRALYFFEEYLREDPKAGDRQVVEDEIAEIKRLRETAMADAAPPPKVESDEHPVAVVTTAEAVSASSADTNVAAPEDRQLALALSERAPPQEAEQPVYARWWFWAGVGAVVAAGAVTAVLLTRTSTEVVDPTGSLGAVDAR
jgi:tetratricopeptide (TPR) repeat protein